MDHIRQPAATGTFYPADSSPLRALVTELLETAVPTPVPIIPKAIIAPHAGYIYSGPVAGSAFKPLYDNAAQIRAEIRRVVIIGPAHTLAIRGLATVSTAAFATPLGLVPVDKAAVENIRQLPQVQIDDDAHMDEHGLEVMLPFLQQITGNFSIIPVVAGQTSGPEVAELLDKLWGGPETLILISSDLSHYHDYQTAKKIDHQTAEAIQNCRPDKLKRDSACGLYPIQGLLLKAGKEGLTGITVDLRNSGDTTGGKFRVVGYGAFLFHRQE